MVKIGRRLQTAASPGLRRRPRSSSFRTARRASCPDAASVRQSDRKAGALIAERVIARGSRRLALLTPSQRWPAMIEWEAGIQSVAEASERIRSEVVGLRQAATESWMGGCPESALSGPSPIASPQCSNCEKFTNASEGGSQFESRQTDAVSRPGETLAIPVG